MRALTVTIIAIIGVVAVAGAAYFGWNFLRGEQTQLTEQSSQQITAETNKKDPEQVFKNPAIDYWLAPSEAEGFTAYYVNFDGQIIKTGKEEEKIGEINVSPVLSILPSPNGNEIIASFGNPQNPQFSIFNASTTEWRPLAPETKTAVWSPDGSRIAAIEAGNTISIYTYNSSGNNKTKITDVALFDAILYWPSKNLILIAEKPSSTLIGNLWTVNVSEKTIQLAVSATGLMFNPFQEKGFMFSSEKGLEMRSADARQTIEQFPFFSLPNKCVAEDKAAYCALITNALNKYDIPDDYLKKKLYSDDMIVKYNFEDKTLETILNRNTDFSIDATNLKINGDKLFFINRYDNNVYSITLK